jgi:two-component system nitrogen regulation response regulator GlnG
MDRQLFVLSSVADTVTSVTEALEPLQYSITVKKSLATALKVMHGNELVLLDLPSGVEALRELKAYCPEATVIVTDSCVDATIALDEGAYYHLKRPLVHHELKSSVKNALQSIRMKGRLDTLDKPVAPNLVLGAGAQMKKVLKQMERLAKRSENLMILGEDGTGRKAIARTIHRLSPRRLGPFIIAGEGNESLEDELFGSGNKMLAADGGTILIADLEKIDDFSRECLRSFLVNGNKCGKGIKSDVRVLLCTETSEDKALASCIKHVITVPSLRDRPDDIIKLAMDFVEESVRLLGIMPRKLTKDSEKALLSHKWPGNTGELKRTIRRACMLAREQEILPQHITVDDGSTYCSINDFLSAKLSRFVTEMAKLGKGNLHGSVMGEVEKTLMDMVLKETGSNLVKSASILGITRTTLRSKIKNYGLNGYAAKTKKRKTTLKK